MKISPSMLARAEFPQVLDSTMLLKSACPIKFFYEHCLNLHPAQKSIHLHAGGAFAHGVEHVRKAFYIHKLSLEESLFVGWREFINYWGDYDAPENSYKDFYNVSAALFDYFHNYNPNNDYVQPLIKHDGSPAVEFTFSIPLPITHPVTGDPLIYAGRCDMVGVYQNATCIVDEKTTYTFGYDWSKVFAMRGQFIGYTYAAQQYKMPASMCIVRGIAIQQRSIKHLEAILQFPQWQVDRWYQEALKKVEMLKRCWEEQEFPLNYGDICSSYGGCPMLDLCTSHQPENWFSTFDVHKWNPLNKDEASA
jgi:hypothetical protein